MKLMVLCPYAHMVTACGDHRGAPAGSSAECSCACRDVPLSPRGFHSPASWLHLRQNQMSGKLKGRLSFTDVLLEDAELTDSNRPAYLTEGISAGWAPWGCRSRAKCCSATVPSVFSGSIPLLWASCLGRGQCPGRPPLAEGARPGSGERVQVSRNRPGLWTKPQDFTQTHSSHVPGRKEGKMFLSVSCSRDGDHWASRSVLTGGLWRKTGLSCGGAGEHSWGPLCDEDTRSRGTGQVHPALVLNLALHLPALPRFLVLSVGV